MQGNSNQPGTFKSFLLRCLAIIRTFACYLLAVYSVRRPPLLVPVYIYFVRFVVAAGFYPLFRVYFSFRQFFSLSSHLLPVFFRHGVWTKDFSLIRCPLLVLNV